MPKPTKGPRIGGSPAHQRIILANLASQLFEHGRITTTESRARRVQPLAEKLITKAKRGDLHARRVVLRTITDTTVVHVLFTEIAPTVAARDGGCTRITKIGSRKGDNAPMALLELVTGPVTPKKPAAAAKAEPKAEVKTDAKTEDKPARRRASRKAEAEAAEVLADEVVDEAEDLDEADEPTEADDETAADEAAASDDAADDDTPEAEAAAPADEDK